MKTPLSEEAGFLRFQAGEIEFSQSHTQLFNEDQSSTEHLNGK
jgi:hypothetical protein